MIWSKPVTVAELNAATRETLSAHLGMEFLEVGDDYLLASMPVDRRTMQPAGLLHGGASVALAESLGSIASTLCLDSAAKMPVGVEINANHLKSVRSGEVIGKVTSIRRGRSIHVWNIEIQNDAGELVCVSRLTVMIVDATK